MHKSELFHLYIKSLQSNYGSLRKVTKNTLDTKRKFPLFDKKTNY